MLDGPDFPPNLNIGALDSLLQSFDYRIVLPTNILEMFIVHSYLKTHYKVPSSKFIFYHQLDSAIDSLISELGIETEELMTREGCSGKLWIVLGVPDRFRTVY